jgi:DNA-directed RNA polymerase specialized sigma24 family protein
MSQYPKHCQYIFLCFKDYVGARGRSSQRPKIAMETSAELDNLLLWLGQDGPTGAVRYVEMRQRLVALFQYRRCEAPEELADETLDRTARAILKPGFVFEGDRMVYLRGVARNVYLESLRRPRTVSHDVLHELTDTAAGTTTDPGLEPLYICLDRCLAKLPSNKRALLLRYYRGEKSTKIDGRLRMAQEEGIELNALRLQVFRLRKIVRQCVERCAETNEIELQF